MKAAVVTFPGSNCDDDLYFALHKVCGLSTDQIWHKDRMDLKPYDLIGLPGGFSYGDYLRCGAMAAFSPIMENVKQFADQGGLVIGICNGFQILCEAGLLPGALARNGNLQFVCRDVPLTVQTHKSPWTQGLKKHDTLSLPIAHGDGRFVLSDEDYAACLKKDQIILTYTQENPNGSVHAIAGICNEKKNVLGMMPHPERAADLRSQDGLKILSSVISYIREKTQ